MYSAVIKTGATSEALTGVIGKADGTGFVFDTGSLTGIDLNDYTITPPDAAYIAFTPGWTGTNVTNTNNTTPYWIFDAAANITNVGSRALVGLLQASKSRMFLTIELFVVQDAATVANFRVQNTGNAQSAVYLAKPDYREHGTKAITISAAPQLLQNHRKRRYQIYNHRHCGVRKDRTFLLGTR